MIGLYETFCQKSIYGRHFNVSILREIDLNGINAIIPKVSCSDVHITGFNHLIVEEDDRLKNGFISW